MRKKVYSFGYFFMASKDATISVFDNEVSIEGTIYSNGTLDIGGQLNGKIIANILTIKDGGVINGDVFANEISISQNGIVKGNIVAKKIHLSKDANINGNLSYNTISMEDGAVIEGQCNKFDNEVIDKKINSIKSEVLPNQKQDELAVEN